MVKNKNNTPAAKNMEPSNELFLLDQLERKIRWLSTWTIHNANHIRPSRDGLKVGGHQASSASMSTLMTALYMNVLRPEDRVAVKPHASPLFHSIQYLFGKQTKEKLVNFRSFGGAQSYPSRTKDTDDVDFSTGSVGLGVGISLFASLIQDYVKDHDLTGKQKGRMIALMGDAELDEGNIYEALLEGWKKDVRNLWWVIDYNRQSLDGVINDDLFQRIKDFFGTVGWDIITMKYGKKMLKAFDGPAGKDLKGWIDTCPNQLYSALTYRGGAAWRERLSTDLASAPEIKEFLDSHDDESLHALMVNLGGHCLETILEAFNSVKSDRPHCFIAYTIKGYGLPLAGHKDNHSGMLTPDQMDSFKTDNNVPDGQEWDRFAGLEAPEEILSDFLDAVPFAQRKIDEKLAAYPVPLIKGPSDKKTSTQVAFGKVMNELASDKGPLADSIVTVSPDVASSTNLGAWVNKRGVYHSRNTDDTFKEQKIPSALKWEQSPSGQHIELGIAENNLFTMLGAMGLSDRLFGARLIPVGTLYDPFISRGLDALNYACYQDARFLLVATPSGISLAPEGGAHQSANTPLIGMAQDRLATFEPAFSDELTCITRWALDYMQRDGTQTSDIAWLRDKEGGSVYMRLSTRMIDQPERTMDAGLEQDILAGGYWLKRPKGPLDLVIAYTGAIAPEAIAAYEEILDDIPNAGLLAITSGDRLNAGWHAAKRARQDGVTNALSHVEHLLADVSPTGAIVTVIDAHPTSLSWIGGVWGHRIEGLGVEHFGQSGDLQDLYKHYRIDSDSIVNACAGLCVNRRKFL